MHVKVVISVRKGATLNMRLQMQVGEISGSNAAENLPNLVNCQTCDDK